jgi:hypothetical protein
MTIVESKIDAVKVYHRGATVYRVAELRCEGALPREVELRDLPLSLYDPTVRVRIEHVEPAGTEVIATDVRVGLHAVAHDEAREDADRTQLKALQRKIIARTAMLKQITLESTYLQGMEVPRRPAAEEGKPPPASPMAARVVLEQLVDDALRQRIEEARALQRELKQLDEEEQTLQDRIARSSTARQVKPHELRKTVVARLAGDAKITSARLVVEYFVPGARWAPSYQCRLTRDCRQAELQLRSLVCQRSGEDWRGVRMILSTASPMTWTELPELTSIRIGRAQPASSSKRGFRPPPRGAEVLFGDYDRDRQRTASLVPSPPSWSAPTLYAGPPPEIPEASQSFADSCMPPSAGAGSGMPGMAMRVSEVCAEVCAPCEESAPRQRSAPPPPPAPSCAPAPARLMASKSAPAKAKRARRAEAVDKSDMLAEDESFGLQQEAQAAAEAIVFPLLRLSSPQSGQERNRLVPVDLRTTYLELLSRARVEVAIDVLQVVYQAQQAAGEVAEAPLPEGACDVRSAAGYFDFCYEADARVDLESDGTFHSLALGTRQAPTDVRYIVVPREDTSVFRMARLTNPLSAPLLPGPVEVHVGGDYVLTSTLPTVGQGGEFQLGLGVEQAIKVARNTHYSERRSGTKVVAMTELQHVLDVEIVNHLDREVLCEVRERLPQPGENAEVVVEESDVKPAWESYDQRERGAEVVGGRRWNVKVTAGATQQLHAGYVVKIYANNELVGGNRREA